MTYRRTILSSALLFLCSSPAAAQEVWDPLEPMNRAIFSFNDTLDEFILEPVAKGYDQTFPDPVKLGVKNFFNNLEFPILLVSDILQLKFSQAADHTGRFVINSTVGVLGLMDIAKKHGLPPHDEDTGSALGHWGVGPGPYLVLPFLGPSNLRDGVSRIGDGFLKPQFYLLEWEVAMGATAVEFIDRRRQLIEAIETGKAGTLDYYTFMKSSYMQYRLNVIYDGDPPPELLEETETPAEETVEGSPPEEQTEKQ